MVNRMSAAICMILCQFAIAQSSSLERKIERLFTLEYTKSEYSKALDQFFTIMYQQFNIEDDALKTKFKEQVIDQFLEQAKVIYIAQYATYFTESDIDEIIAFNESAVGKKLLDNRFTMLTEMAKVGAKIPAIAQEVANTLQIPPVQDRQREAPAINSSTAVASFHDLVAAQPFPQNDIPEIFRTAVTHDGVTVVKFYGDWCPPCRSYAPVFEKVAEQHQTIVVGDKQIAVKYISVNISEYPEVQQACKIQCVPTTVFYVHGKRGADLTGSQTATAVLEKIKEVATK